MARETRPPGISLGSKLAEAMGLDPNDVTSVGFRTSYGDGTVLTFETVANESAAALLAVSEED